MLTKLKWFNLALRGLMEFSIIAAFAYWGYKTGNNASLRALLSIAAPLLAFGFWSLIDFRGSGSISEPLRLFQELFVSGLAALAWYSAGAHLLGWSLGLISVVHHSLVYALGERLLQKG